MSENELSQNSDWQNSLSEDLRSSESLGKFKDINSLAKSYLEAEQNLAKRISIPEDSSPAEEWGKFYQKLGMPEDKKYLELDARSSYDDKHLSSLEAMLFESGISKRQGQSLLNALHKYSNSEQEKQKAEDEELRKKNLDWLNKAYSDKFNEKVNVMKLALQKFGSKELAEMVESTGYNPAIVDLLVKVGKNLKPDSLITSSENKIDNIEGPESALKEIKKLESDDNFMLKYKARDHAGHADAVKRLNDLYDLAYKKK